MKKHWAILITVALVAVAGCDSKSSSHPEADEKGTAAALSWLGLIDEGQYAKSWEESASPFKNSLTAQKWETMATPVRAPLGKVKSREVMSRKYYTSLPNTPKGEYLVIQFKTDFENKLGAIETVTPMVDGGTWKVSGYYIK